VGRLLRPTLRQLYASGLSRHQFRLQIAAGASLAGNRPLR